MLIFDFTDSNRKCYNNHYINCNLKIYGRINSFFMTIIYYIILGSLPDGQWYILFSHSTQ